MASITGKVTEELEPVVRVRLLSGREVSCLVDTGFTGALVLPLETVRKLNLPIVGDEFPVEMVGGEKTKAALAIAEIEWLGEIRPIFVIIKDDYLLGSELLKDTELVIDYRKRTLSITN